VRQRLRPGAAMENEILKRARLAARGGDQRLIVEMSDTGTRIVRCDRVRVTRTVRKIFGIGRL